MWDSQQRGQKSRVGAIGGWRAMQAAPKTGNRCRLSPIGRNSAVWESPPRFRQLLAGNLSTACDRRMLEML